MNVSPPINSADLCIACGLCCDGSLFERAAMPPGEQAFVASLGLEINDENEPRRGFKLPCPLFNGCCSIYDQPRPHVCGAFRCKLLANYESSQVEKEAGLQIIERARAMQAELRELHPTPVARSLSLAEVQRQMRSLAQAGRQERRAHIDFLLLAGKYEIFLRRHFLLQSRKGKKSQETSIMGE